MTKDERGFEVDNNTKGKSTPNPKRYKGDVMTQVWLDSRLLATMSRWLDEEDMVTRFLSDVVRESIEMLVEIVVNDSPGSLVDDTDEARNYLVRKYNIKLSNTGKAARNLEHNRLLSSRRETAEVARDRRTADKITGVEDVNKPMSKSIVKPVEVPQDIISKEALEKLNTDIDKEQAERNKAPGWDKIYNKPEPGKDKSEIASPSWKEEEKPVEEQLSNTERALDEDERLKGME